MKLKYLFLSLIILCSQSVLAAEISGTVYLEKNKHKAALGHTPMRMHVYKDNYEFSGAEIKTDSSGHYVFRNLKDDPQYSYLFYPVYEGVNYPFEEVTFSKGKVSEKKDFTLTESTGSNKDVSVDEKIYFDLGKKDVWKITHEIVLENKGDLLYHADRSDAQPLVFSLFEGGFDMSYLDGVTRNNSKIDEQKDSLQVFLTITTNIRSKSQNAPERRIAPAAITKTAALSCKRCPALVAWIRFSFIKPSMPRTAGLRRQNRSGPG